MPEALGSSQDWIPIDFLAEVLIELAFKDGHKEQRAKVFHPLNPQPTTWDALLPAVICSFFSASKSKGFLDNFLSTANGKMIEKVPFNTWLQRIRMEAEAVGATAEKYKLEALLDSNPAVKLLSFYERLAEAEQWACLETNRTEEKSEKLRTLETIKPEWMQAWAKRWLA